MPALGVSCAHIFPHEACAAAGDDWGAGTGKYRLVSNDDATEAVFERFGDYPGADGLLSYFETGNSEHHGNYYSNEDFDRLMARARTLTNHVLQAMAVILAVAALIFLMPSVVSGDPMRVLMGSDVAFVLGLGVRPPATSSDQVSTARHPYL